MAQLALWLIRRWTTIEFIFYLFVKKVHIKETKQMTSQLDRKVHDSNTCPTLKHKKNTLKNKNTNIQKHE